MHQQIDRREADFEPMARAGKAERPKQRRGKAASDAEQCRRCIVLLRESASAARPLIHGSSLMSARLLAQPTWPQSWHAADNPSEKSRAEIEAVGQAQHEHEQDGRGEQN